MSDKRDLGFFEQFQTPAVRNYIFVGFAALLIYYTLMSGRGSGDNTLGALITIVIAIPGLTSRWIISPVLFLILVTYLLIDPNFGNLVEMFDGYGGAYRSVRHYGGTSLDFNDLLLGASILIYLMAHYRLMSLVHKSMPDDPPPRRKGQAEPRVPRAPVRLYADKEIGIMLGVSLACVVIGAILWIVISDYESTGRLGGSWGVSRPFARFMVFLWSVGTGAALTSIVFRHIALRRMSWYEARLIVQDLFWQETGREQERIYRWKKWGSKQG